MSQSDVNATLPHLVPAEQNHEALQSPTRPVSLGWQLLLSLANLVVWLAIFPTYQILLPAQIGVFDSSNKVNVLALISFAGGVAAILGNLLAGALSDLTTSRFGRRRPWVLAGAAGSVIALTLLANAPGVLVLGIALVLFQFFINVDIASLAALVPDQVPVRQRAIASAFVGLALPLGTLIGLTLVAQVTKSAQASYYTLAAILLLVLAVFVLIVRDTPLPKQALPAFSLKTFLKSYWLNPRRYPDFGYTWIARACVIFGYYTAIAYLFYFLQDVIRYDRLFPGQTVAQGVATFQGLATLVLIIATISSGIVSDRLQRRKVFVIGASGMMAVALAILAFASSWPAVLVAAALLGIGFGVFLSGDLALQTQVLPNNRDRGKDLGLLNTANLLPQLVVPIVASVVLSALHTYTALFLVAACAVSLGAVLTLPIKSVK
jgi:MFS family permease